MDRRADILIIAALTTSSAFAGSETRTSAFEYDPATGRLTKEIIEPGDSNLCLVTAYSYDAYGNKASATTRNCNGSSSEAVAPTGAALFPSRTSTNTFDSQGRFAISSSNPLGHTETRVFEPLFGAVTSLTGPNQLTTKWTYDGFGRRTSELRADHTGTGWSYNPCGVCPPGGKYSITVTATGSAPATTYYDILNRVFRTETAGFDGTLVRKDTQYDGFGRVAQVSLPYFDVAAPVWTVYAYDILGRVISQTDPNGGVTQKSYNGLTTTVTNALNQTETRVSNSQGQLVQVTR